MDLQLVKGETRCFFLNLFPKASINFNVQHVTLEKEKMEMYTSTINFT